MHSKFVTNANLLNYINKRLSKSNRTATHTYVASESLFLERIKNFQLQTLIIYIITTICKAKRFIHRLWGTIFR